jgi:hypothetical protein
MALNFLEQFASEWYEYQGYLVRRNIRVGRLPGGGYESELDVVAFHPVKRHLVHLEASTAGDSWKVREIKCKKKFKAGKKHIRRLFKGLKVPGSVDQIVLLDFASTKRRDRVAGARILLVEDLLVDVLRELRNRPDTNIMVPEQYPILRTLQHVADCWGVIVARVK